MKFSTYQKKALETALPIALDLENYLIPMIVGEVGELIGADGKAHRDSWSPERIAKEMAKEYGDICWGVAVALHVLGVKEEPKKSLADSDAHHLALLHHYADQLLWDIRPHELTLSWIWNELKDYCLDITSHTFEQVLEMNVTKLADRQARGVIEGSGNDR